MKIDMQTLIKKNRPLTQNAEAINEVLCRARASITKKEAEAFKRSTYAKRERVSQKKKLNLLFACGKLFLQGSRVNIQHFKLHLWRTCCTQDFE